MASSPENSQDILTQATDDFDIYRQSDFNYFVNGSTMFMMDLKGDKIHCHKADKVTNSKVFLNLREHMKALRKDVFKPSMKIINRTFAEIIHHFQTTQPKKKIFCRNACYYLVKKYFTEGVQYVKQGEKHTYKAIGQPLDIYISSKPLELKTFRSSYDRESSIHLERISPGETKTIPPDTYYIAIAPCHTFFIKGKIDSHVVENSAEILPSFSTEAENHQGTSVAVNNSAVSKNQTEVLPRFPDRQSPWIQPSGSREDGYGNSRQSTALTRFSEPSIPNSTASTGITRRFSSESDRLSKRLKSNTSERAASTSQMEDTLASPSPNALKREMELIGKNHFINNTAIGNHRRAVFAVRRDSSIESYTIRPDSTFQVFQDGIMTGSFVIENEDMEPPVIEYHGEVQYIREVAKFNNGSTFETTLTVQKDLLNELQDPVRRKEKIVVDYFFELAFKSIEAAYKRFSEMRNTKMIGSCVPAIVLLNDAHFCGALPDVYEAKP